MEGLKKLVEIEGLFQVRLQNAKIEVTAPNFDPPDEIKGRANTDALRVWDRVKNRYENAQKINELSPKFGRIQPILHDLKSLTERFPASSSLKGHLAYLYYLLGNRQEAIQYYQDTAISSGKADDWLNLAVMALEVGKEELACYSLEQVFYQVAITEEKEAWYVYVNLLKRFCNYSALSRLCETIQRNFSDNEMEILLKTGIYLLKNLGNEQQATELVYQWIAGHSLKSLVLEAFKQLEGQPILSYQNIATELNMLREKKAFPNRENLNNHRVTFIHIDMKETSVLYEIYREISIFFIEVLLLMRLYVVNFIPSL